MSNRNRDGGFRCEEVGGRGCGVGSMSWGLKDWASCWGMGDAEMVVEGGFDCWGEGGGGGRGGDGGVVHDFVCLSYT